MKDQKPIQEAARQDDATDAKPAKPQGIKGFASAALDTLINCFLPLIPAIAGAGMVKVVAYLLSTFGLLAAESVEYQVLSIIGDGVFYFLPLMVAVTAANKMETSPFLAMGIAAMLMHPNLLALGEAGSQVSFFGAPLTIVNYSSQALPVILSVWLMKYVERFFSKISPDVLKAFLPSLLTFLVCGPIALVVIGPLGTILGDWFAAFVDVMNHWGWIAVAINGGLYPLLVLTGMHNALVPLIIQMFAAQGFDSILLPSGLCANLAQSAAATAVAVRTKNANLRSTALSAAASALFGVAEPALYGVNLRLKKPFVAVVIGSFIGGCVAGLTGLTAYTFVIPSLLSLPIFAGPASNFLLSMITVPATFLATFAIAYLMGFEDVGDEVDGER